MNILLAHDLHLEGSGFFIGQAGTALGKIFRGASALGNKRKAGGESTKVSVG